jgi:MYXO-CTERM domain-containing protein
MKRRITILMAVAALGVGATAPAAFAQEEETTTEEDGGSDYGWIGLLGLAGLAGLMGRKRDDRTDVRVNDETRR